jgi:hypothetical protein
MLAGVSGQRNTSGGWNARPSVAVTSSTTGGGSKRNGRQ